MLAGWTLGRRDVISAGDRCPRCPAIRLMWVLIASELAVFGLALLGYAGARARDPLGFAAAQDQLDRLAGTINTAILLTSGLLRPWPTWRRRTGSAPRARVCSAAAGALGVAFLAVKGFEYSREFAAGARYRHHPFFTLYFLITGFHALHVVLGLVILAIVARSATPAAVETGTAFWHMVDLIWVSSSPASTCCGEPCGTRRSPVFDWAELMALSALIAFAADVVSASRPGAVWLVVIACVAAPRRGSSCAPISGCLAPPARSPAFSPSPWACWRSSPPPS